MMDPNDIIDTIVDAIDYAELTKDPQGLMKARRLLNNELRQTIDHYIQTEIEKASLGTSQNKSLSRGESHRFFQTDPSRARDGQNFNSI